MITCLILDICTELMTDLYEILPEWSLDIGVAAGESGADIPDLQYTVTNAQDPLTMGLLWMQKYNSFIPFDHVVTMVSILSGFVVAIVALKAIRFLMSLNIAGTGFRG